MTAARKEEFPMTAAQMWAAFAAACPDAPETYEAWALGAEADALARLVLAGIKTATSSAYPLYALRQEPLPRAGACDVLLDAAGRAVCVLRTTRVYVVPFHQVTAEHARREGEGDRSLESWRRVHADFFTRALAREGLAFTPETPVVCEEFEVAYRP